MPWAWRMVWKSPLPRNHLSINDLGGHGQAKQATKTGRAAATCNCLIINDLRRRDHTKHLSPRNCLSINLLVHKAMPWTCRRVAKFIKFESRRYLVTTWVSMTYAEPPLHVRRHATNWLSATCANADKQSKQPRQAERRRLVTVWLSALYTKPPH